MVWLNFFWTWFGLSFWSEIFPAQVSNHTLLVHWRHMRIITSVHTTATIWQLCNRQTYLDVHVFICKVTDPTSKVCGFRAGFSTAVRSHCISRNFRNNFFQMYVAFRKYNNRKLCFINFQRVENFLNICLFKVILPEIFLIWNFAKYGIFAMYSSKRRYVLLYLALNLKKLKCRILNPKYKS